MSSVPAACASITGIHLVRMPRIASRTMPSTGGPIVVPAITAEITRSERAAR